MKKILLIILFAIPLLVFAQGRITRPTANRHSDDTQTTKISDGFMSSHSLPHNFDIDLKQNRIRFFVSTKEYRQLAKNKDVLVEGIVIIDGNMRFILAPHDLSDEFLNWDEAMRRYSDLLPSKEEAELWHKYKDQINLGLKIIDGKILGWGVKEAINPYRVIDTEFYWTKTQAKGYYDNGSDYSEAYYTCFDGNNSLNKGRKVEWVYGTDGTKYEEKDKKCRAIYRF